MKFAQFYKNHVLSSFVTFGIWIASGILLLCGISIYNLIQNKKLDKKDDSESELKTLFDTDKE